MTAHLPRVTYTNINIDFSPVHEHFERLIPAFKREELETRHPNIIDGKPDDDGEIYPIASPIDHDMRLGEFIAASPAAVDRAITSAKARYEDWRATPWKQRVLIMRRVARMLDERKYELATAALLEVGKSQIEAIGEAEELVDFVDYFCDEMEANEGYITPLRPAYPNEEARSVMRPYGVFACISPFNFPTAMCVNMFSGAILAGNTVVFKPSPNSAFTASLLVKAIHDAGLPPGVLNLVCGGDETGKALVNDPRIDGVVFTGSYKVGMHLFDIMSRGKPWVRPCIVEMGGKNPAYVTQHAEIEVAAAGVIRSAFGMGGQKCSANSKVYVHESVADAFVTRLVEMTKKLKLGNPEHAETYLGPVVNKAAGERYLQAVEEAKRDGEILCGGKRQSGAFFDRGWYVEPTIIRELPAGHRINKEELFAPILSVQTFTDLADAVRDGNDVVYGLTAGLYSHNRHEIDLFYDLVEAGVTYVNRASGSTTGTWPGSTSFCGWKGSGVTGKGGMGPFYIPQFMREQSQTIWHGAG